MILLQQLAYQNHQLLESPFQIFSNHLLVRVPLLLQLQVLVVVCFVAETFLFLCPSFCCHIEPLALKLAHPLHSLLRQVSFRLPSWHSIVAVPKQPFVFVSLSCKCLLAFVVQFSLFASVFYVPVLLLSFVVLRPPFVRFRQCAVVRLLPLLRSELPPLAVFAGVPGPSSREQISFHFLSFLRHRYLSSSSSSSFSLHLLRHHHHPDLVLPKRQRLRQEVHPPKLHLPFSLSLVLLFSLQWQRQRHRSCWLRHLAMPPSHRHRPAAVAGFPSCSCFSCPLCLYIKLSKFPMYLLPH
mmetsp:Transcript_17977/g.41448  ORF Transcript_17977/g.41448 Transcript_17977/m.41448 type:complete len:296 (-) Transcript_17977:113-1000(-)